MKTVSILDIPITLMENSELQRLCDAFLQERACHHIVTANAEYLVAAHRDLVFRNLIQRAALATADGSGLIFAARFLGYRASLADRVTGVSLTTMLLHEAERRSLPTCIILKHNSITAPEKLSDVLHAQFPKLPFKVLREPVSTVDLQGFRPVILFAALGAPDQDFLIDSLKTSLPDLRIAVGVGGTFDFISGTIIRAPGFLRAVGIEWAWRLAQEPKRIGRIIRAVVVFPYIVMRSKL